MYMPGAHPRWGVEFDWLAIDGQQQVALFASSGYGAVPEAVLRNVALVDAAVEAIQQLPAIGTATMLQAPGNGVYSDFLQPCARGIFVYDWTIWHGPYRRIASPTVPVFVKHLPAPIQEAAELVDLVSGFSRQASIAVPYVEPE